MLYPSLYQLNTRVWLTELSRALSRPATLDDVPDSYLDRLAEMGFDWVWLLSVWRTGAAGQRVSRTHREWRDEFQQTLPDLCDEDIGGSGFAITDYTAHPGLGGDEALARLRARLRRRGIKLMLDFVPNHTGLDHPWAEQHPEYYINGTEADLAREPQNFTRPGREKGSPVLANGRDPNFPGWPDTLQLDYSNPATPEAMLRELEKVAARCDGVRCDMAMLILPEVFARTWNRQIEAFWPKATQHIRKSFPAFTFMAEAYWDLEWTLQQQGFDYTYDKRLYDRLRDGQARPVRDHLHAALNFQNKLARFLENHDEPRAATAFEPAMHQAAALITFLSPGLRFFHQGQFEGYRKRISPHLVRGPLEPADPTLREFYCRLLSVLRQTQLRDGQWRLLECIPAWQGNRTSDCFLTFSWMSGDLDPLLVTVNYAPNHSQCYVQLPCSDLACGTVLLKDLLSSAEYERDGNDLNSRGLYLDLPPWGCHVFSVSSAPNDNTAGISGPGSESILQDAGKAPRGTKPNKRKK